LTARVREDVLHKLQFSSTDYVNISLSNDRPNVTQIVRAIEHPISSFIDLDFVVPHSVNNITAIPKTFLYTDDIKGGASIVDYLNARVPPKFRDLGLIRPYNAAMSQKYRKDVMRLFHAGIIRVLVCTDAAGMGCNIADIDVVVQWKMPPTLSAWVQRAGRAARGPGRQGLAVMLVERSAFETRGRGAGPRGRGRARGLGRGRGGSHDRQRGGGRQRGRGGTVKMLGDYAILHGINRGALAVASTSSTLKPEHDPVLTADSPSEGLFVFIQATVCRRKVLTKVFNNPEPAIPSEHCCDLCNPSVFTQVRSGPAKTRAHARKSKVKRHAPSDAVRDALYAWRRATKSELYPRARWSPCAILDDDTCELLACITFTSREVFNSVLATSWARWEELGDKLFDYLTQL
ncbi:P-loop containing nucleoside triphosphate hydrolase protein, partial [Auriscalpium vulgare]